MSRRDGIAIAPTERVIGVHVRKCDPPQLVAEDIDGLLDKVGEEWGFEQCDNCGNSLYIIERKPNQLGRANTPAGYQARCVPDKDLWAPDPVPEGVGCGMVYSLRWYGEDEVQW